MGASSRSRKPAEKPGAHEKLERKPATDELVTCAGGKHQIHKKLAKRKCALCSRDLALVDQPYRRVIASGLSPAQEREEVLLDWKPPRVMTMRVVETGELLQFHCQPRRR